MASGYFVNIENEILMKFLEGTEKQRKLFWKLPKGSCKKKQEQLILRLNLYVYILSKEKRE